jgi:hypothetical protein
MPRFGSQTLVVGRRNHLGFKKRGQTASWLFGGFDQLHASIHILLICPIWVYDDALGDEIHVKHKP